MLEIACGSGQHAVWFAAALPGVIWLPTDRDPLHVASTDAWCAHTGVANVLPARLLDVRRDPWPDGPFDVVYCANLVHIAPWEVAEALLAGARAVVPTEGQLVLYGPYRLGGAHTAPSNAAFDASLRERDPAWGVRDAEAIVAAASGFVLERRVEMPAENQMLILRRVAE